MFEVTVAEGYELVSVKVDGVVVTAEGGKYTGRIAGNTLISVETKVAGAKDPVLAATLDFTAQGYANQAAVTTLTVSGYTATFDKGTNSNGPKYYTSGTAVRVYGSNTITITGKSIVKIVFTFSSGEKDNAITSDVGTFATDTWTGSADSVTFTIGGTSGHRRIAKIEVYTLG